MNIPYDIKNVPMAGSIVNVKIEPEWNSCVVKMRETNVDLLIYDSAGSNYITVTAGSSFALSSHNFSASSSEDSIKLEAASGTAEILGFKRD